MSYVADKEIHVLGIQRSGQHGVLAWILGHFNQVYFKNGMTPQSDKHDRCIKDGSWWHFDLDKRPDFTWENKAEINSDMDAIILGTEYVFPNIPMNPRIEPEKAALAKALGKDEFSKERHYVYVLRSPYNQLASWIKWKGKVRLAKRFAQCWINGAEEALGITDLLPHPKIFLYQDKWFKDEEYRKEISEKLNLPFSDRGLNAVLKVGRNRTYGSSFDKMEYKGNAQKMNVTERWKEFKDDEFFKSVMSNERLRELSEQIFGRFPV